MKATRSLLRSNLVIYYNILNKKVNTELLFKDSIANSSFMLYLLFALQTISLCYGHKRARNKRIGPGGGTRRLHHKSFI
jgi:hypothetical protein